VVAFTYKRAQVRLDGFLAMDAAAEDDPLTTAALPDRDGDTLGERLSMACTACNADLTGGPDGMVYDDKNDSTHSRYCPRIHRHEEMVGGTRCPLVDAPTPAEVATLVGAGGAADEGGEGGPGGGADDAEEDAGSLGRNDAIAIAVQRLSAGVALKKVAVVASRLVDPSHGTVTAQDVRDALGQWSKRKDWAQRTALEQKAVRHRRPAFNVPAMRDGGRAMIGMRVRVFYDEDPTGGRWEDEGGFVGVIVNAREPDGEEDPPPAPLKYYYEVAFDRDGAGHRDDCILADKGCQLCSEPLPTSTVEGEAFVLGTAVPGIELQGTEEARIGYVSEIRRETDEAVVVLSFREEEGEVDLKASDVATFLAADAATAAGT